MSISSALLERLTASRSQVGLVFRPVDVEQQAHNRKLPERGAADGAKNFPASGSSDMALAEQEVVNDISVERDRNASELASQLRAYRDALSSLQTGMDIAGMRQSADEAITQFQAIRARWSGDIGELRAAAVGATTEFREFKQKHRINRLPRLPKRRFLSFALLFVFIVIESVLNGLFFASGSDMGLVGGVGLASALSAINVIVGFLNGRIFLPLKNSVNWFLAGLSLTAFLAFQTCLIVFNGFVAHYRDLYEAAGDATQVQAAWSALISEPFALVSISSWLLFGAGMFFSGLSTWKGYGFDDPYPGYGAVERRRRDAIDAYSDERQDLIDEAGETADEYTDKAHDVIERLRASSSQRQQVQNARARMLATYNAVESDLANAAHQLLTIYRHANVTARTTPPPDHFGVRFVFPARALDRPEFHVLLGDQGLEHDADTLIAELDGLRQRVLGEHALVLAQAPGEV